MEHIYRILKTIEGQELLGNNCRWLDFRDNWHQAVEECLDKDYLRRKDSHLILTAAGADFIFLYEEMLELLPKKHKRIKQLNVIPR